MTEPVSSSLPTCRDLIQSIVAAVDARDVYTAHHSDRVAAMAVVLARVLHLSEDDTTTVQVAAFAHDIGKISMSDAVLRKAGPLTDAEWEEMRRCPVTGYDILRKVPLGARIIAVADSIDAMMSNRSYRPAMTATVCHHEIEKNSGVMYDPQVVAAAMNCWDELVSRYTEVETPPTPYFDRLQLEHTRQAHDYLLANQGSHITLAELAARFHLSQSSLKICFKALYGVPVASYLRGLRMDTAANLLRSSDLPVAEIAHRVGYEDPSRFAAAFRRHTGCRPTELRRVPCPTPPENESGASA